jgi:hypothetical protein
LQIHHFADPDNEITFRAISALPALPPDQLQQALLQTLMRLGFPDIDLSPFFAAQLSDEVILELVSRL